MVKYLAFIFCLISVLSAHGQKVLDCKQLSKYLAYVKGDTFEGSIISKDFVLPFISDIPKEFRFTPTIQDIEIAESLLLLGLKAINSNMVNQGKNFGPVIHENLAKYARQYYGYITIKGERIVLISNLWGDNYKIEKDETWKAGAVIVMDGGSNYWQVKVNLTSQKLFDLNVNGSV